MTGDEAVLGGGRYDTSPSGYRAMLRAVRRWPERTWAIEGCQGIGRHLANWLVADGERVVDVPPKLFARTRGDCWWSGLAADLPGGADQGAPVSEGAPGDGVIGTPDQRLRVFVSSTLGELAAEPRRNQIRKHTDGVGRARDKREKPRMVERQRYRDDVLKQPAETLPRLRRLPGKRLGQEPIHLGAPRHRGERPGAGRWSAMASMR
jgi:hypothetical protein